MANSEKVVILDAGAQYGKVIDRKVRELCVESEIMPLDTPGYVLKEMGFKGVIISGGPTSVNDGDAPTYDPAIFHLGIPLLGICYGLQMLNKEFGGTIKKKDIREDGQFNINVDPKVAIFRGLAKQQNVLLTHGDSIDKLAKGFTQAASSGKLVAAIANDKKRLYGVQFHPEVDLTENGKQIFKNFLHNVCGLTGTFSMKSREEMCILEIQRCVGSNKVLALVSGGVDSTVCAALLRKALKEDQVVAVHIDNGFMRKNESESVKVSLERLGLNLQVIDASLTFYNGTTTIILDKDQPNQTTCLTATLNTTIHPEEKRQIIGDTFMKVADQICKELDLNPLETLLAQGTLRPDLIESASSMVSGIADTIKTHHNDTFLVRQLRSEGRVVEPLKDFHKDEVRQIGRDLGLPAEVVERHPFPGPGLAIRVICAEEPYIEKDFGETNVLLKILADYANADKRRHALMERVQSLTTDEEKNFLKLMTSSQKIYATLLPIKTVGVQGDCRTYNYCAALSTESESTPWNDLYTLGKIIPKICHNINRVVYIFGSPVPDSPRDVTATFLTPNVLGTLRQADHLARKTLMDSGFYNKLSQMPIVLVPLHFDRDPIMHQPSCQRSVAIRTFLTNDFMTGVPAIPGKDIPEKVISQIVNEVASVPGISRVMYDLTGKPPGTTEWE
ncbi:GMP synthase [glutamine-hydrolyzing] [Holothuria leucospilota]|uniref:GMP synthase (glutamine-hydrolyzing) n=1 Tax=Holothuria leucospilota TaxID=206669 RepID=A0A9Q1BD29_HOLLE|nr:GMP synthase [glutamine-hydrolyzing] [Holothuria leucospilota]